MQVVVRYKKTGLIRFLSAIETANAIERNFRRAEAPLEFSQGFHKKPRLSFLDPTPTGVFNLALYVIARVKQYDQNLLKRLKATAVDHLEPVQLWWSELDVNKIVDGYLFRVILPAECIELDRFDPGCQLSIAEKDKVGRVSDFFKCVRFERFGKFVAIVYYQDRKSLVRAKYLYQNLLVKDYPFVLVQRLEAMCGETALSELLEAKSWAAEC